MMRLFATVAAFALFTTPALAGSPPAGTWTGDLQKWNIDASGRKLIIESDGSCRWGFVRDGKMPGKAPCSYNEQTRKLSLTTSAGSRVELNRTDQGWKGWFELKRGFSNHDIEFVPAK